MMTVIGMIVGLMLLGGGMLVLIGLVRLLCEGKTAAVVSLVVLCGLGLLGLLLIGGLLAMPVVSVNEPVRPPFEVHPQTMGDGGWVQVEPGRMIQVRSGTGSVTIEGNSISVNSTPTPPRSTPAAETLVAEAPTGTPTTPAPPDKAGDKAAEQPLEKTVAEVEKFEDDPLSAAARGDEVVKLPRPDWVDRSPEWIEGEYRVVIASGLFPTVMDAGNDVHQRARAWLAEYYDKEFGASRHLIDGKQSAVYDEIDRLIDGRVLREQYIDPVKSDVLERTMYRQYRQLAVTPELRNKLADIRNREIVDRRLVHTGQGAGAVMGLLFLTWGALKMTGRRRPTAA